MAQAALGDDWQALRSDLVDLYSRHSQEAGHGTVEALADYLLTVAKKPAA
jgi:hypothetical protein